MEDGNWDYVRVTELKEYSRAPIVIFTEVTTYEVAATN